MARSEKQAQAGSGGGNAIDNGSIAYRVIIASVSPIICGGAA